MLRLTNPTVLFCDGDNAQTLIEAVNEIKLDAKIFSFDDNVAGTTFVNTILESSNSSEYFL